jgi:magnesium transporter
VNGVGSPEVIRELGEILGLHRLALEDVVHMRQRPKVDAYDSNIFIIAQMLQLERGRVSTEQLSLFLGSDFIVTIQEEPGDCLDAIRAHAREKLGRLREAGADYLAYAILDAVVDEYFPLLETHGDKLENLEHIVLAQPSTHTVSVIHELKRDLLVLRRTMWPTREALNVLQHSTSALIKPETRLYLRDVYDHSVQLLDLVEIYRELSTGLIELHMTSVSNRLNQVMKVLTVISTIFIPLTFIAGVYGMNFKHMPELERWWAYPAVLIFMALIAGMMMLYFWRKGWFKAS